MVELGIWEIYFQILRNLHPGFSSGHASWYFHWASVRVTSPDILISIYDVFSMIYILIRVFMASFQKIIPAAHKMVAINLLRCLPLVFLCSRDGSHAFVVGKGRALSALQNVSVDGQA